MPDFIELSSGRLINPAHIVAIPPDSRTELHTVGGKLTLTPGEVEELRAALAERTGEAAPSNGTLLSLLRICEAIIDADNRAPGHSCELRKAVARIACEARKTAFPFTQGGWS